MKKGIFLLVCGLFLIYSVVYAGWNKSKWNNNRWGNQEWNIGKWGQDFTMITFESFNVSDGEGGFEVFNVKS